LAIEFRRFFFHHPRIIFDKSCVQKAQHKHRNTHYFEIIFIDSSNLFIAFDYLPNWRQHPPHNELLYAFWLFSRVGQGANRGPISECSDALSSFYLDIPNFRRR
jgi:hypothetical protein